MVNEIYALSPARGKRKGENIYIYIYMNFHSVFSKALLFNPYINSCLLAARAPSPSTLLKAGKTEAKRLDSYSETF